MLQITRLWLSPKLFIDFAYKSIDFAYKSKIYYLEKLKSKSGFEFCPRNGGTFQAIRFWSKKLDSFDFHFKILILKCENQFCIFVSENRFLNFCLGKSILNFCPRTNKTYTTQASWIQSQDSTHMHACVIMNMQTVFLQCNFQLRC